MKLSKLLNVFHKKDLIDESTLARDFAVLREYAPMIFPTSSENDIRISSIKFGELRIGGNTTEDFLIYHTRDNNWLAHYLNDFVKFMQKMEKRETQLTGKPIDTKDLASLKEFNQPKIRFSHVKKFVETDAVFDQERNNYEEDLVRAQIKFMMHDNKPNGLLMHSAYNHANNQFLLVKDFDVQSIHKEPNADKVFRNTVVKAMSQLGIDQHSVEVGLEKHADLWRDQMMTQAYYNQYPLQPENENAVNDEGINEVVNVMREGFKDTWLRARKGKYFEDNQNILEELGKTEMQLKPDEAKELNEKMAWWNNHYSSTVQSKQAEFAQNCTDQTEDILGK